MSPDNILAHGKMLDLVIKIEPAASPWGGAAQVLLAVALVVIFAAVVALIMKRK